MEEGEEMRLKTIWSIPAMSMSERLRRTVDWAAMEAARKLPPRVKYWATMQSIARATRESPNIPATTVDQVLSRLDGGPK
jgi:hypothetical protein